MARKALIAANWKMYKTPAEAKAFVDAFLPSLPGTPATRSLCFHRQFYCPL
jgi:triosephosphate isomerase